MCQDCTEAELPTALRFIYTQRPHRRRGGEFESHSTAQESLFLEKGTNKKQKSILSYFDLERCDESEKNFVLVSRT